MPKSKPITSSNPTTTSTKYNVIIAIAILAALSALLIALYNSEVRRRKICESYTLSSEGQKAVDNGLPRKVAIFAGTGADCFGD